MSRIFKVCISDSEGLLETIAIKPCLKNFDNFKEEVFIRMPELKSQNIKIFYFDSEGDKITIFNTLDFGIFYEAGLNKIYVLVDPAANENVQKRSVHSTTEELAKEAESLNSTKKQPEPSPQTHHANVICDQCEKDIYGFRYKCLQCVDYDLCMDCESKMNHNDHIMLRIPDSKDADFIYRPRCGKRIRLRCGERMNSKDEESSGESKRHHHRRQSSKCNRNSNLFGDILSQWVQSFAKANASPANNAAPNAETASGSNTKENANNQSPSTQQPQTPIDHLKNAENYAKASIDIFSNLAHNITTLMDPFANLNEFPAPEQQQKNKSAENENTNSDGKLANDNAPKENGNSVDSETVDHESFFTNNKTDGSKNTSMDQGTQSDHSCSSHEIESANIDLGDGAKGLSNTDIYISATTENEGQSTPAKTQKSSSIPRDWTLLNADDLVEENQHDSANNANKGAIPKSSSNENITKPNLSTTNYEELSRILSAHIADLQEQFKPTVQTQTENVAPTPTPTPVEQNTHPDKRVNDSLAAMITMGFSNEGGWLVQLLESVEGSIPRALDLLQPHK